MLAAATNGILQTQVLTIVGDYSGTHQRGRALGIVATVSDIGATIGPLLGYTLLPVIGLYGVFTIAASITTLVLPLAGWVAWREYTVKPMPAA